jgi:hypothetical protein
VQAQTLSNEGKSATLVSLKHLAENSVPGTEALLKKAAEEIAGANLGGVFEAQASEWIRANQATYGRLEQVAVDSTGGFNRIDTLSESYAFQMKSKFNAAGELALRDVDVEALIELVDQAQEAGNRIPALVSSNTVAQDLLDVCAARGIQVIRVDVVR